MEIQAYAAMLVQAMFLDAARAPVLEAQANPIPASAPSSDHAAVILQLSTAAQSLLIR